MANPTYRATINGFWCHNESWDDAFNWDGKHDEVFLAVNVKVADSNGTVLYNFNGESELMGDTWRLPNRIQAGSASDRGGIVSGDKFPPVPQPWKRQGSVPDQRFPPYVIWEGELAPGRDMVMLTPTLWEWDPGAGFWNGWLEWQVSVDDKYGMRAKEIFGKIWPVAAPVFDAVSLGIQTVGTLAGLWSPLGRSMRRPIGTRRNPNDPDGFLFNPQTIALNTETADYLSSNDLQGLGKGTVELHYEDDPYLRGVYSIFVQIEKLTSGDLPDAWADAGHANGVRHMAAMEGRLYAVTGDNRLWRRDAVTHEINWTYIGHANSVVGLAALSGRLFCATADNVLWSRDAAGGEVNWDKIGHANGVVAMAAANGMLFCATGDNRLWSRPPLLHEINWTHIGHVNGAIAMTGIGSTLYCMTGNTELGLHKREAVLREVDWAQIGHAPANARAIAVTNEGMFATTGENRLIFLRALP